MDPTRCEGGCGRWIHHPKRFNASRMRRFCVFCQHRKTVVDRNKTRHAPSKRRKS